MTTVQIDENTLAAQLAAVTPDPELSKKVRDLAVLAESINGPNTFSIEAAAYGYIQRHERVLIPGKLRDEIVAIWANKDDEENITRMSVTDMFSIAYWNWARLRAGGLSNDNAFFIAMYRARLVYTGYLYPDKETRCVTVDEVDYDDTKMAHHTDTYLTTPAYKNAYDTAASDAQKLRAYMEHGTSENFKRFLTTAMTPENLSVIQHVTFTANQMAAATYLMFRQHGHHYKPEMERKYENIWRATTIDKHPKYPGHELIHRTAIHSFGVKTLHDHFYRELNASRLAETFVDRADVAPAGVAVIATCHAAISLMKSLPIWPGMYATYKTQIDALEAQAKKVKAGEIAIRYHKNANLFGMQRIILDASIAHTLAPIAKGFIDAMGEESDLSGQRTLDKRAGQNPLMVALVNGVIGRVVRGIAKSGQIEAALNPVKTIAAAPEEEEEEEEEDIYA